MFSLMSKALNKIADQIVIDVMEKDNTQHNLVIIIRNQLWTLRSSCSDWLNQIDYSLDQVFSRSKAIISSLSNYILWLS